jgi:simple sugar transport system permease protein
VAVEALPGSTAPTNVDPAPSNPTGRGRPFSALQVLIRQREATVTVVTLAVILYFGFVNSSFFSTANVITICQYMASIAVIGFGEVLILVLGEIDLSAGAVYLTSPWLVYFFWKDGIPVGVAIALALLCCVGIGLVNGLITVWLNVSSLIVTLAMNYILFGFVLIKSADIQEDMPGQGGTFGKIFGIGDWSTILWAAGIMVVIWALLKRTRFGIHVIATGGNLLGAAESGIPVRRVKVWCFIVIAATSGLIGIMDGIRIGSVNPGSDGLEVVLPGIVAAVVGGTALTGGRGTILGTALGAIFLGALEDGFNLTGVNANWFFLAEGVMILVAMIANVQLGVFAKRLRR